MISFFNSLKVRTTGEFTRAQKAAFVKERAEDLLDKFTQLECDEVVNYYLHCAYHHLPDVIEACPIELTTPQVVALNMHISPSSKLCCEFIPYI